MLHRSSLHCHIKYFPTPAGSTFANAVRHQSGGFFAFQRLVAQLNRNFLRRNSRNSRLIESSFRSCFCGGRGEFAAKRSWSWSGPVEAVTLLCVAAFVAGCLLWFAKMRNMPNGSDGCERCHEPSRGGRGPARPALAFQRGRLRVLAAHSDHTDVPVLMSALREPAQSLGRDFGETPEVVVLEGTGTTGAAKQWAITRGHRQAGRHGGLVTGRHTGSPAGPDGHGVPGRHGCGRSDRSR